MANDYQNEIITRLTALLSDATNEHVTPIILDTEITAPTVFVVTFTGHNDDLSSVLGCYTDNPFDYLPECWDEDEHVKAIKYPSADETMVVTNKGTYLIRKTPLF